MREVARHLAVRMSFEDVIRVAQAKTSRERLERVRAEVRAKPHEPLEITEHFKPGNEEIAADPAAAGAARWLLARRPSSISPCMCAARPIWGFARLRLLAGLRWWRPHTYRYVEEQAEIERWLAQIRAAQPLSLDLAREIAELARLIKGYGDTYKRGLGNYRRITDEVIAPALAGRHAAAGGGRCRRQCARGRRWPIPTARLASPDPGGRSRQLSPRCCAHAAE